MSKCQVRSTAMAEVHRENAPLESGRVLADHPDLHCYAVWAEHRCVYLVAKVPAGQCLLWPAARCAANSHSPRWVGEQHTLLHACVTLTRFLTFLNISLSKKTLWNVLGTVHAKGQGLSMGSHGNSLASQECTCWSKGWSLHSPD